jgi:HEAT repeat protein
VFISYVRQNRDIVDRLAAELSNRGATVWLDRNDIGPGSRWKDEIKKAIKSGDFFLACFSKEYDQRQKAYMNEELTLAIDMLREIPTDRTWFIPVIINNGRIPQRRISNVEDLSDLNAVDLSEDWNHGMEKILDTIGLGNPAMAIALPLIRLAGAFEHVDQSVRAIEELGRLQLADGRVLGVLIDATTSASPLPVIKEAAVRSLIRIGQEAVPALAAALPTAEEVSRKCMLSALMRIGPPAAAAVPEIITVLRETGGTPPMNSGTVQERAIRALAAMGPAAKEAVPHLSTLLKDSHAAIRTLAAYALTMIEPRTAALPLIEASRASEIQQDIVAGIIKAGVEGPLQEAREILGQLGLSAAAIDALQREARDRLDNTLVA